MKIKASLSTIISLNLTLSLALSACSQPQVPTQFSHPLAPEERERISNLSVLGIKISTSTPPSAPLKSSSANISNSDMLSCYHQVCDSTSDLNSGKILDPYDLAGLEKLSKALEATYAESLLKTKTAESILNGKTLANLPDDPKFRDFITAMIWLSQTYKVANEIENSFSLNYINVQKYHEKHASDPSALPDVALKVINAYLLGEWFQALIHNQTPWDYIKTRYPGEDIKKKLHWYANQQIAIYKKLIEMLDLNLPVDPIILKIQQELDLTPQEGKSFISIAISNDFFNLILNGSLKGIYEESQINKSKILSSIEEAPLKDVLQFAQTKIPKEKKLCLSKMVTAYQNFPSTKELNLFGILLDKIRSQASITAKKIFSDPTRYKGVVDKIKTINFTMPLSREDFLKTSLDDIRRDIESSKFYDTSMSEKTALFLSLTAVMAWQNRNNADYTMEIFTNCKSYDTESIYDSAYTLENRISLSVPTVNNPAFGSQVVAHELGHIVFREIVDSDDIQTSNFSTFGPFEKTLSCESTKLGGNLKYLNESFADGFSAQVILDMKEPRLLTNLGCVLQKRNGGEATLSLKNTVEQDSHPSGFFRALIFDREFHEHLPQVCQSYLKSENAQNPSSSCY